MTCQEKCVFYTKKAAKAHAKPHHGYGKRRVYRCPQCGYWHLTSFNADAITRVRSRLRS